MFDTPGLEHPLAKSYIRCSILVASYTRLQKIGTHGFLLGLLNKEWCEDEAGNLKRIFHRVWQKVVNQINVHKQIR